MNPFLLTLLLSFMIFTTEACKTKASKEESSEQVSTAENRDHSLNLAEAELINSLANANVVAVYYVDIPNKRLMGMSLISKPKGPSGLGLTDSGPTNTILYKNIVFHLPQQYKAVLKDTGDVKVLGEGANGVGFLVEDESGKKYVLKYFKRGGGLVDNLTDLENLARNSVQYSKEFSTQEQERINNEASSMSAKEDIIFHTQQDTEKALSLGVTLSQYRDPVGLLPEGPLRDRILLAKSRGVGSVSYKALDISYGEKGSTTVMKETFLLKSFVEGERLKEIIENDRYLAKDFHEIANAITTSIGDMSTHGLFYNDLNLANWILYQHKDINGIPTGEWDATPFDMKPGERVDGIEHSGAKNVKGMRGKVSPLGSPTGFWREAYVKTGDVFGFGRSQPLLQSKESELKMQILEKHLEEYQIKFKKIEHIHIPRLR